MKATRRRGRDRRGARGSRAHVSAAPDNRLESDVFSSASDAPVDDDAGARAMGGEGESSGRKTVDFDALATTA
jgi:hypothetical protein